MENNEKGIHRSILKVLLPVLVVIFIGLLYIFAPDRIGHAFGILSPLFGAVFIAYLLDSFVRTLEVKCKLSRRMAVLVVYLVLLGLVAMFLYSVIPMITYSINEVVNFAVSADSKSLVDLIERKLDYKLIQNIMDIIRKFSAEIISFVNNLLLNLSNFLIKLAGGVASKVIPIFTTIILSIYMLLEKNDLLARAKRVIFGFLNNKNADYTMFAFGHANRIFKCFLIGKIMDCTVVGLVTIVTFTVLGIPSSLLLGTIIGVANIVPYFGPIIGAVPVVTIVLFMAPHKAILALVAILIIGQVDANFIDPRIVGKNTGVSAFWTITSVVLGGAAFGFLGVVFAVPTVVLFKTLVEDSVDKRLIQKNMGSYELENIKIIGQSSSKDKKKSKRKPNL